MGYHPKPSSCAGCPAYFSGKSFVPPADRPNPKLVIIGQGPGQDEALDGKPFVGISGRKLDSWLLKAGVRRDECAIGNVVWCWLPGNRPPTKAEVEHCRKAHWESWLHAQKSKVIVTVGVPATQALGPKAKPGTVGEYAGRTTVAIAHPTYILRGNWAEEPLQPEFLKLAKDIANGEVYETDPKAYLRADSCYEPRIADLHAWKANLSGEGVAVDIETAGDHLRLVGLCDIGNLRYLGFPVRGVGGASYWGDDLREAVEWLFDLLSDESIGKVFHNGQAFDVPMLERNGFCVRGYVFDTMLGMHIAHTGVPKDLESLAMLYLRMPGWKGMVKGELEGEGK